MGTERTIERKIVEDAIEAKGAFRALKHRNFKLFFWGQLVSIIGTWSQMLAISWLVWRMTGSALWLGAASFATQIPILILGLAGGYVADRFDRLRTLTAMQALCMLQALVLAWLALTGRVQLWHLLALGLFLGTVYAFEIPVRQAFVMDVAGRRDLLNAVSLTAAMFHLTRMLGPTIAGAIVAWKGEGVCFLFNSLTFLALIGALLMVRRGEMAEVSRSAEPMLASIRAGLSQARRSSETAMALGLTAVLAGVGMQFTVFMPMLADRVFGGGAAELGWMMGASGAGSLAGALWLSRRRSPDGLLRLAARSALAFSAALALLGLVRSLPAALVVLAAVGLTLTVAFSSINTMLQHRAGDAMRGRMMGLYTVTFMGLFPIGSLAAGWMAWRAGVSATMIAAAAICFASSLAASIRNRKRGQVLT